MAEVLEQLGKMRREEQLRVAHWILDAIARGDVRVQGEEAEKSGHDI